MIVFTVQSEWKVLVLEDTPERIVWFKERLPNAVYCTTAGNAIDRIRRHTFNAIFLDHDLSFMHTAPAGRILEGSGGEVALYLKKTGYGGIVCIHSRNDDGVKVMRRILPAAKVARFGEFDIKIEVTA
jgi:CheY-like chemotaxis protein